MRLEAWASASSLRELPNPGYRIQPASTVHGKACRNGISCPWCWLLHGATEEAIPTIVMLRTATRGTAADAKSPPRRLVIYIYYIVRSGTPQLL
jgi:hypothetical protein